MTTSLMEIYTARMKDARDALGHRSDLAPIFDPSTSNQTLHRFLIEFCALGVQMTAPVDGWIRRAGQRCQQIGLVDLGRQLTAHAEHEAGHDALFVEDVHALVLSYKEIYGVELSTPTLLAQKPTAEVQRYVDLHEQTIAGEFPFAQVAIELEIEGMSVLLGPKMISHLGERLGEQVVQHLSFLKEHIALDVGHTAINSKMMERLLEARPEALELVVATGHTALDAYCGFLGSCMQRAIAATSTPRAAEKSPPVTNSAQLN